MIEEIEEIKAYKVGKEIYEDKNKARIAYIENRLLIVFGNRNHAYEIIEWLARDAGGRKSLVEVLQAVESDIKKF